MLKRSRFYLAVLGTMALSLVMALPEAAAAKSKKKNHRKRQASQSAQSAQSTSRSLSSKQAAEAPVVAPEDPSQISLVAKGAIVIDALTGIPVYEKAADDQLYPASTTKILTALLVIEEGDLDKVVDIELVDTQVEPSAIYFKPGDRHTRRELLYALMLKSANDVAQALARDNAGSIEAFAEKMTRRAHALGAVHSHFKNPHGLHHPEHYTTPRDLAMISRVAMQQPIFRSIVGTQHYTWQGSQGTIPLKNSNRLLANFPGCIGLKTGYTVKAQHVLSSAAMRDGREVICIVMHSDKPGKWTDSKLLLSYALAHPPQNPHLVGSTSLLLP